jgi:hypothetical protein
LFAEEFFLPSLAFVLIIGTPERFQCGKQIGSHVGLIPSEDSSAVRQRLGHISKQGNSLLRSLLGETAQVAVRCDSDWRRRYVHLAMRRERNIAKVAMAGKLAIRLYWMWRNGSLDTAQSTRLVVRPPSLCHHLSRKERPGLQQFRSACPLGTDNYRSETEDLLWRDDNTDAFGLSGLLVKLVKRPHLVVVQLPDSRFDRPRQIAAYDEAGAGIL